MPITQMNLIKQFIILNVLFLFFWPTIHFMNLLVQEGLKNVTDCTVIEREGKSEISERVISECK